MMWANWPETTRRALLAEFLEDTGSTPPLWPTDPLWAMMAAASSPSLCPSAAVSRASEEKWRSTSPDSARCTRDFLRIFVAGIVVRAALGLQRNGHASGVRLDIDVVRVQISGCLDWPTANIDKLNQHDHNRVTEDGAEAVALALCMPRRKWRVVRRMQREEHADWWLECEGEGGRQTIALEVSGVQPVHPWSSSRGEAGPSGVQYRRRSTVGERGRF